MFAIEFINTHKLEGVDWNDAQWTRMLQRFDTDTEAERERAWLVFDDEPYTYRVVEVVS